MNDDFPLRYDYIANGDCLELMKNIPDNSVDLVLTDPPYLQQYKSNRRKSSENHKFKHEITNDNNPDFIYNYIKECYRILKPNKAMYCFANFHKIEVFKKAFEDTGFNIKNLIVWVKNNWIMGDLQASFRHQYELLFLVNKGRCCLNGKRITDIWHFDRVSNAKLVHQNQKPIDLIKQCIQYHSKEGDIVFDGTMGALRV